MKYEWDSKKELLNVKKHGVSFKTAKEALTCGAVVILKEDKDHNEERYIFLGMCKKLNVCVVVVTYPRKTVTRIISARRATKKKGCFMKRNYDFSKGVVIKGNIKSKSQIGKAFKAQQKVLTSIRLDKDLVDISKKLATRENVGYLTWINRKLREAILSEKNFEMRIRKLEKAVFKKKAL